LALFLSEFYTSLEFTQPLVFLNFSPFSTFPTGNLGCASSVPENHQERGKTSTHVVTMLNITKTQTKKYYNTQTVLNSKFLMCAHTHHPGFHFVLNFLNYFYFPFFLPSLSPRFCHFPLNCILFFPCVVILEKV
jgi:hypothetical protein